MLASKFDFRSLPSLSLVLAIGFLLPGEPARCQDAIADIVPNSWESRIARANAYDEVTRDKVFRTAVKPNFFGPEETFAWYRVEIGAERFEYVLVDTVARTRQAAFDHEWLAQELGKAAGQPVISDQLSLGGLRFSDDAQQMDFRFSGRHWRLDRAAPRLTEVAPGTANELGNAHPGLQALERLQRSSAGGDATSIDIENRTDQTLKVLWHDPSGQNQPYGEIGPGEHFSSSTYAGHVWLLTNKEDQWVAAFRADLLENQAIVDTQTVVPAAPQRRGRRNRDFGTGPAPDQSSPDGRWVVFYREHNVILRDRENDQETALTSEGSESNPFSGRVWWSPDSLHFVVLKTERAEQRKITLVESSPADQLQPKLLTIPYTKPGDALDHPRPYLFHVLSSTSSTGDTIPAETGTVASDARPAVVAVDDSWFPNPFELNQFRWRSDSTAFTFVYNARGHQALRVISVDANSGQARPLIDETSDTFICYSHKFYYEFLEATNEILWMTERDGWNHLVLLDATTGEVKNRITSGEWVVREVERLDIENRQIWLQVGGLVPGEDPYHVHLIRVNLDGSQLVRLTDGDGNHSWDFSPDGRWMLDTFSRVDLPPVTTLRNANTGELICELERGDWSALLATGWSPPERFVAKGRDGVTDIYGIIVRPMNFDPSFKYPVLEDIYAGPQSAFTPKSFGRLNGMYQMAELGFIVVKLDGMGTSQRSKAFHDVCWKNLGDSGFPDRIAWIRAAAESRPEMDLSRIGIWGGSAGGQSALRALLAFGDFYHAAAADCGCHDNRMDKIWWNEQWMGYPVEAHYEEQSNVTQAHRLNGKLLLTVGELDTNVDPASTMQVANALIKANKDFDLIVFPGGGHGSGSSPYGKRRMMEFFMRSLGGPIVR